MKMLTSLLAAFIIGSTLTACVTPYGSVAANADGTFTYTLPKTATPVVEEAK